MRIGALEHRHPLIKALFVGCSIILGNITFGLLAAALSSLLFNIRFQDAMTLNSGNPAATRLVMLASGLGFLIPAIFSAYLLSGSVRTYLRIDKSPKFIALVLAVLFIPAIFPLMEWILAINKLIVAKEYSLNEAAQEEMFRSVLQTDSIAILMLNILLVGVLPALGEELIFRGALQRHFTDWTKNADLAILLSATLFAAIHWAPTSFVQKLFMGIVFGYFTWWSKSIWLSTLAHFFNNAAVVVSVYLYPKAMDQLLYKELAGQSLQKEVQIVTASAIGGAIILALMWWLHKVKAKVRRT